MTETAWVVAALCGLYALHRVATWMEARGWIYYRRRRGSSGALGTAALEVHSLFEPGARHVLEERRREHVEDGETGDPPATGRE